LRFWILSFGIWFLDIGIYLRFDICYLGFHALFPHLFSRPSGTLYSLVCSRFPADKSAGYFQPSLSGFFSAHRLMGFPCKTFPVIFLCLSRRDIRKIALAFMPGKYCLFYQKVPKGWMKKHADKWKWVHSRRKHIWLETGFLRLWILSFGTWILEIGFYLRFEIWILGFPFYLAAEPINRFNCKISDDYQ